MSQRRRGLKRGSLPDLKTASSELDLHPRNRRRQDRHKEDQKEKEDKEVKEDLTWFKWTGLNCELGIRVVSEYLCGREVYYLQSVFSDLATYRLSRAPAGMLLEDTIARQIDQRFQTQVALLTKFGCAQHAADTAANRLRTLLQRTGTVLSGPWILHAARGLIHLSNLVFHSFANPNDFTLDTTEANQTVYPPPTNNNNNNPSPRWAQRPPGADQNAEPGSEWLQRFLLVNFAPYGAPPLPTFKHDVGEQIIEGKMHSLSWSSEFPVNNAEAGAARNILKIFQCVCPNNYPSWSEAQKHHALLNPNIVERQVAFWYDRITGAPRFWAADIEALMLGLIRFPLPKLVRGSAEYRMHGSLEFRRAVYVNELIRDHGFSVDPQYAAELLPWLIHLLQHSSLAAAIPTVVPTVDAILASHTTKGKKNSTALSPASSSTAAASSSTITIQSFWSVGESVDCLDTRSCWCEARIKSVRNDAYLVHFQGWSDRWDEWIPADSSRIHPYRSKIAATLPDELTRDHLLSETWLMACPYPSRTSGRDKEVGTLRARCAGRQRQNHMYKGLLCVQKGLPKMIESMKEDVVNDLIMSNLTDPDGAGLSDHQRSRLIVGNLDSETMYHALPSLAREYPPGDNYMRWCTSVFENRLISMVDGVISLCKDCIELDQRTPCVYPACPLLPIQDLVSHVHLDSGVVVFVLL